MHHRHATRPALYLLAAFVAVLCIHSALYAGGWPRFALPVGGVKNKSGLRITVDSDGLDGNGYRPVRIEVTPWPLKPLAADRQIRVVLQPKSYTNSISPAASQIIELPEGSTSVKATIAVPQTSMWHGMGIETYEGGRKLLDLSNRHMGWVTAPRNNWDWTEDRPAMLFIDPEVPPRTPRDAAVSAFQTTGADPTPTTDLPDVRPLIWLFGDPTSGVAMPGTTGPPAPLGVNTAVTDVALLSQISSFNRVEMLPPAELPRRWIDFSQYDLIAVSYADLQLLAEKHPQELTAIRQWLFGGPLLIVYGTGDEFEHLANVEKLLDLSPLPAGEIDAAEYRHWDVPQSVDFGELKTAFSAPTQRVTLPNRRTATVKRRTKPATKPATDSDPSAAPAPTAPFSAGGDPPFLLRPAGLGCVVAIGSANPFPAQVANWSWIFNSVPDSHWRWYQRNGFSLHRTNDDYWKFLIPGVGRAPVWTFLLLVTLFAIVIGPVNYAVLDRSRRLYLLLITVPAGALVMTLALFSYAVVADGLGVRLRSRSFTELDQRSGMAAAWSRQSYYAAITPSQGLVFPEDTTVFPIVFDPGRERRTMGENDSLLAWQDGQRLRSGFLSSRTATQFMVHRVTKTAAQLVVRESRQSGQPPQVENRLGAPLHYLLLRDRHGGYYVGQSLATDTQATLSPIDPSAAEKELANLARPAEPSFPDQRRDAHNSAVSFLLPRMGGWMSVDSSSSNPAMAASLLETNLMSALKPSKEPLAPGSYTAIIEQSPVVPLGVPRATEEASLHLLRGTY